MFGACGGALQANVRQSDSTTALQSSRCSCPLWYSLPLLLPTPCALHSTRCPPPARRPCSVVQWTSTVLTLSTISSTLLLSTPLPFPFAVLAPSCSHLSPTRLSKSSRNLAKTASSSSSVSNASGGISSVEASGEGERATARGGMTGSWLSEGGRRREEARG